MAISINWASFQTRFIGAFPLSVLTSTAQIEIYLDLVCPPSLEMEEFNMASLACNQLPYTYQLLHFTLMVSPGLYVASLWTQGHSSAAIHPPLPSDTSSLGHTQPETHCVLYCSKTGWTEGVISQISETQAKFLSYWTDSRWTEIRISCHGWITTEIQFSLPFWLYTKLFQVYSPLPREIPLHSCSW